MKSPNSNPQWRCVEQCGACCHLDPRDRPALDQYLTPEELEQYLSLVGQGGWCIHFDHPTRQCSIYDQRPQFCRVQSDRFEQMYQISPEEFNEFAIACCCQQIEGVYGSHSQELSRYSQAIF